MGSRRQEGSRRLDLSTRPELAVVATAEPRRRPAACCGRELRGPATFLNGRNSQMRNRTSQRENHMTVKRQRPGSPVAQAPPTHFLSSTAGAQRPATPPVCTACSFSGDVCQLQNPLGKDGAPDTARQNHRRVLGTAAHSSRAGPTPCGVRPASEPSVRTGGHRPPGPAPQAAATLHVGPAAGPSAPPQPRTRHLSPQLPRSPRRVPGQVTPPGAGPAPCRSPPVRTSALTSQRATSPTTDRDSAPGDSPRPTAASHWPCGRGDTRLLGLPGLHAKGRS